MRSRLVVVLAAGALLAACSTTEAPSTERTPQIVVTYSVLGSVVESLVGDRAEVTVIIPNGQDPHDFSPSARDVEAINDATFVVANGLDFEEGLVPALAAAGKRGTPVFLASDHVEVRMLDGGDEHGGGDPHIWVDPLTLSAMLPALGTELGDALGTDLTDDVERVRAELADADARTASIVSELGDGECRLVTGHDSLGYFADRYGCTVVGAIIPSLTSTAEASAKELAELRALAETEQVAAIFTEPGTSIDVADQIADEIGVPLIELPTIELPDDGSYLTFITRLATVMVDGLVGR